MHQSVATIDSPEFLNLQPLDINPLMSKCEIKVMYLGHNRKHGYISKAVAEQMAQTLPGTPIVGYYSETKKPENFEEIFQLFRLRYTISKMALRIKRYTYEQTPFMKSMIEKGKKHLAELTEIFNLGNDDKSIKKLN